MQWLTYASYARYSYEGVVVSLYGNNRGALHCDNVCRFKNSEDVLDAFDMEESALFVKGAKVYFDCVVLLLFFFILRLTAYLVLRYRVKSYN